MCNLSARVSQEVPESVTVSPNTGVCDVPQGVHGPFGRSAPKVSRECPRSVQKVSWTFRSSLNLGIRAQAPWDPKSPKTTPICYAVADQDKTCTTKLQTLNPDKGDSVWKRRTLNPGRQYHASRLWFTFESLWSTWATKWQPSTK